MVVFVEAAVMDDPNLDHFKSFTGIKDKLMTFRDGKDDLTDKIDFIICLGGDGTLLYASQLFQQSVPPVMAFHLGSLGFLTPFRFDNFQEQVNNVLEGESEKFRLFNVNLNEISSALIINVYSIGFGNNGSNFLFFRTCCVNTQESFEVYSDEKR